MKKLFFGAAVLMAVMCSCSTNKMSTASVEDVTTTIESNTSADLVVSGNRISYTFRPHKVAGNVYAAAVAAALKANGNADILVQPQFETTSKRGKIKQIVVTGYPATYKNFKVESSK